MNHGGTAERKKQRENKKGEFVDSELPHTDRDLSLRGQIALLI